MNSELLQNSDVMVRLLILAVPTVITFLVSVIFIMISKNRVNAPNDSAKLFLSICATNFLYAFMEIILILFSEKIDAEQIIGKAVVMFLVMGLLNAMSCLAKGLIGGMSMKNVVGEDKQSASSRAMIFMSIAEVPGLIALVIYLSNFMK